MLLVKNTLIFIFIASILGSCLKPKEFPKTPSIEFKDFVKRGDSADFIISFKDGDGDIGLNQADTSGNFAPNQPYYYNLVMYYEYKKVDGSFSKFVLPNGDTLTYKYRIPNITPTGVNKGIDGDIKVLLSAPYYYPGHTAIKFEAYIYDRALNKSNVIVTSEITVP